MLNNIEIIIGTYEEYLLGFRIQETFEQDVKKYILRQSFATHCHTSSVRCIDIHGKYLASGGSDDRICIIDMKTRKENQLLAHHAGSINKIEFTPDGSHLFSAGDDGIFAAVRTGSWQIDNIWKTPHSGKSVSHIAIHPTGKLALTIGMDETLRTWNLITGRQVFTVNLNNSKPLEKYYHCLTWSPNGEYFTISGLKIIQIWSIQTAGIVKVIECSSSGGLQRPTTICWLDNENMLVGLNNGNIIFYNTNDKSDENTILKLAEDRIKDMAYKDGYLVTSTSSGSIAIFKINTTEKSADEISSINVDCRPTCINILDNSKFNLLHKIEPIEKVVIDETIINKTTDSLKNKLKLSKTTVKMEIENDEHKTNDEQIDNKIKKKSKPIKRRTTIEEPMSINRKSINKSNNASSPPLKIKKNDQQNKFTATDILSNEDKKERRISTKNLDKNNKNVFDPLQQTTGRNKTKIITKKRRHSISNFIVEDI